MSQLAEPFDLISAASLGDMIAVENILRNNFENVNVVNHSGWTALLYAANFGQYNIIRTLIKYKCNVNFQEQCHGRTALMLAASNGHTRSIDALINYGKADNNIVDYSGNDAIYYAKTCGHGNNKLIKSLLGKADAYEVKGRSYSAPIVPQNYVLQSMTETISKEYKTQQKSYIYNPCETTAFSNSSIWKPTSFDESKVSGWLTQQVVSSTTELTPSSSSGNDNDSTDSSMKSSNHSFINCPQNLRRKPIIGRKKSFSSSSPMPKNMYHLLTRIDLIQYLDLFESNAIDFYSFLTLTDEDFQNLGISSYGHRKKLTIAQKRFHESLDINCTHETFLADYLLNEREVLYQKIEELKQRVKDLEN